jgi:hypothetical protein
MSNDPSPQPPELSARPGGEIETARRLWLDLRQRLAREHGRRRRNFLSAALCWGLEDAVNAALARGDVVAAGMLSVKFELCMRGSLGLPIPKPLQCYCASRRALIRPLRDALEAQAAWRARWRKE